MYGFSSLTHQQASGSNLTKDSTLQLVKLTYSLQKINLSFVEIVDFELSVAPVELLVYAQGSPPSQVHPIIPKRRSNYWFNFYYKRH